MLLQGIVLVLGLAAISTVKGNDCTDQCDLQYPGGIPVTMCGTDFLTHITHSDVFVYNTCYDLCGVMTYYEGQCGCPNECHTSFGQGTCGSDSICQCKEGWTGPDCSQPSASNKCSLHGVISTKNFPFDYCKCDAGWTGIDCSSAEPKLKPAPWGTVFPDVKAYNGDDYDDDHPIWNITVMATIRVEIPQSDYINLLQPWNLYNETYAAATVHFDNGHVQETYEQVGFKIKGQGSRSAQKKGWKIKFNEFVSGQKLTGGVKKLGLKGCDEADCFMKSQIAADLYRAAGVATYRSSFALVYVNSIYTGVYFMQEDIDDDFAKSRFPGDGSGNLMQLYYNVHLGYYGSDDQYYRDKVATNDLGAEQHYYTQVSGNNDWSDFINVLAFVNASSDSDFKKHLNDLLDVNQLLRLMVVESFLLSTDNTASGNNFYFYHSTEDSTPDQMSLITYDFDDSFKFDENNQPKADYNVFTFFLTLNLSDYDDINPLYNRLLYVPDWNATYAQYYETFLEGVFGSGSPEQPSERYAGAFQFVLPWVAKDLTWQLSFGMTMEDFIMDAERSIANLPLRYANCSAQIAPAL